MENRIAEKFLQPNNPFLLSIYCRWRH
jgi:hypothetical protein